jgi:hypothetical protein
MKPAGKTVGDVDTVDSEMAREREGSPPEAGAGEGGTGASGRIACALLGLGIGIAVEDAVRARRNIGRSMSGWSLGWTLGDWIADADEMSHRPMRLDEPRYGSSECDGMSVAAEWVQPGDGKICPSAEGDKSGRVRTSESEQCK